MHGRSADARPQGNLSAISRPSPMTTTDIAGLFALTGQVAFVTGAGKGLGRAICAGFAQAGADIVAVARTASDLEETAREVRAQGRRCLTVTCDVTLDAQVEAAVEKAVEEFGKIDILVNNAGGAINVHALMELPEEEWDSQLDLNLKAAFLCSRAVAKSMMKLGRGKIINIGSRNGFVPSAGSSAPYNVAKAGLNNLTKQLAAEWGDKGIWVNGMAVSAMRTPAFVEAERSRIERGLGGFGIPPADRDRPPIAISVAEPEAYVPIALFLASPASNHLTGDIISPGGVALDRT